MARRGWCPKLSDYPAVGGTAQAAPRRSRGSGRRLLNLAFASGTRGNAVRRASSRGNASRGARSATVPRRMAPRETRRSTRLPPAGRASNCRAERSREGPRWRRRTEDCVSSDRGQWSRAAPRHRAKHQTRGGRNPRVRTLPRTRAGPRRTNLDGSGPGGFRDREEQGQGRRLQREQRGHPLSGSRCDARATPARSSEGAARPSSSAARSRRRAKR